MSLRIWKTARKHAKKQRINDDDILQVATFPHWIEPLDEENPQRELRLGFDTKRTRLGSSCFDFRQRQRTDYSRYESP